MKKIGILLLITLMLSGCTETPVDTYYVNLHKYEAYYQSILDRETFLTNSDSFAIEAVMNKVDDNYRFSVIIEAPKTAMYNIEAMAIIDDGSVSINYDYVMPASGIFDRAYNIVPYQVNEAAGYPRGIILDGLCNKDKVKLLVMVSWTNADSTEVYKEFFELEADINPPVAGVSAVARGEF